MPPPGGSHDLHLPASRENPHRDSAQCAGTIPRSLTATDGSDSSFRALRSKVNPELVSKSDLIPTSDEITRIAIVVAVRKGRSHRKFVMLGLCLLRMKDYLHSYTPSVPALRFPQLTRYWTDCHTWLLAKHVGI